MDGRNVEAPRFGPALFFSTSLLFLVVGCLDLAANSGLLVAKVADIRLLWWVWLMVFGFLQPAVFGAVYAALPSAFGLRVFSRQMVYAHYGLHMAGLVVVLLLPFVPDLPQGPLGPLLLAGGALVFVSNVGLSLRRMARPDAASAFLSAACLWLTVASLLGLPFVARPSLSLLGGSNWSAGWLLLAMAGFCLNVLYAIAYRLLCSSAATAVAWWAFALVNSGIAWSAAALSFGPPSFLLLTLLLFLAGALVAQTGFAVLRRTDAPLAGGSKCFAGALAMVPLVALLALFAAARHAAAPSALPLPVAEEMPGLAVSFAVDPLAWAVGLAVVWAVLVPGLAGSVFFPGVPWRIRRVFPAAYVVGSALVIGGAVCSAGFPITGGALLLALGCGGFAAVFGPSLWRRCAAD